jgi:hypothetical protein
MLQRGQFCIDVGDDCRDCVLFGKFWTRTDHTKEALHWDAIRAVRRVGDKRPQRLFISQQLITERIAVDVVASDYCLDVLVESTQAFGTRNWK